MSYHAPDWNALAVAPLPEGDAIETRADIASDNLLAALHRATDALERSGYDELAERLCESFLRAFQP